MKFAQFVLSAGTMLVTPDLRHMRFLRDKGTICPNFYCHWLMNDELTRKTSEKQISQRRGNCQQCAQ